MNRVHNSRGFGFGVEFSRRTMTLMGMAARLVRVLLEAPRLLALHLSAERMGSRLRESLWLAVTEVNGCRWCAYIHEGMAGASGMAPEDIQLLLSSEDLKRLTMLTEDQQATLAYARAWAERDGDPPTGMRGQVQQRLGESTSRDLHALLLLIDFSNRSGNTLDSLLQRLRHPRRLLNIRGTINDLAVGLPVALFGWPALVAGAVPRWRARRVAN